MTTPTAALVEEAQSMTTDTLIEEAMGEMHRLGIDNLRAKGAIVLLVEALRRAEAERDEARRDAEAYKRQTQEVSAKAIEFTKEVSAKLEQAEAERDAAIARAVNAEQEQADMERLLEMQHERTRQADELWRKQHNKPLTSPDLGTLIEWLMKRAEKAEAERDAQRAEVLRLTGELQQSRKESLERARTVLMLDEDFDEACALGFGLGCMLTNAQWRERDAAERAQRGLKRMQSCLQDEGRRVSELTATRDLLTAENARLQKERDEAQAELEYVKQTWAEMSLLEEKEIKALQARVATLELLLRGGK